MAQGFEMGPMEESGEAPRGPEPISGPLTKFLQAVCYTMLVVGGTASPLLLRVYFIHGGSRKWLSSWLLTIGWPVILLPLAISYLLRRRRRSRGEAPARLLFMTPLLLLACAGQGLLTGITAFLFSISASYLPASTSAILSSTQLAFTSLMAFLIVRQRFTVYTLGAVALLTVGAVVLGVSTGGDRPPGESARQYYLGFFMTLAVAAISGLQLPLVELTYARTKQAVTYTLVCEVQLVISIVAAVFSTVGMAINNDFQAIPREAKEFGLGEFKYYEVLMWSAILWQIYYLGIVGVIFCSSALLSGVIQAFLVPITEILAVFFLRERFTRGKGIALALAVVGCGAYFYQDVKRAFRSFNKGSQEEAKTDNSGVPS